MTEDNHAFSRTGTRPFAKSDRDEDGQPAVKEESPLDKQVGGTHYKDLPIQPVTFCEKNGFGCCVSAVVKYVARYKQKDGLKDLLKAKHYIELLIEEEYPDAANQSE